MAEVELDGHKYRTGKLNVFEQFNVMRRIAPLLSGLGQSFAKAGETEAGMWESLEPLMQALSEMKDEDANYVLRSCLAKCQRFDERAAQWARIAAANGELAYADITLAVMMQLVVSMIQENLDSFFSGPHPLNSLGVTGSA